MTPQKFEHSNWPALVACGGLALLVAAGLWRFSSSGSDPLDSTVAYVQGVARAPLLTDGLSSLDPVGTCAWLDDLGPGWALLDARGLDLCTGQDRSAEEWIYQAITTDAPVSALAGGLVQVVTPVREGGLTVGFLLVSSRHPRPRSPG